MRNLELSNKHLLLGAKMVPFAGFLMPIQYSGVKDEHLTVRNKVGVFDVSHMGEIIVEGKNSLDYLQYLTSNDVSRLSIGDVQYSYFPNNLGGIVDDFLLYKLADKKYMLVVNASNIEKDFNWMKKHNSYKCIVENYSNKYGLLALQGPDSLSLLQNLTDIDLSSLMYYKFKNGNILDVKNVIISRTGYTGELGYELYIENIYLKKVWEILFNQSVSLKPIGLAARDTLRLEKGYCLYGNDINENTCPLEAGLAWVTNFNKKFINSENIKNKLNSLKSKLVGLEIIDRGIARKGYVIIDANGTKIGDITSGTMSPSLNKSIALGYINNNLSHIGNVVYILIRNKKIKAKIVSLPFYEK